MKTLVVAISVLFFCCSCVFSEANDDGMVAHYTFDEGSGEILVDTSGGKNDGKIIGSAWVQGEKTTALDFDGVKDYVDCGGEMRTVLRGPLTVSAWVKTLSKGAQTVVGRGDWNLNIGPGSIPFFQTRHAEGGKWAPMDTLCAKDAIALNEWTHVVAVYDTKRQCMEIFVNGKLSNSMPKKDGSVGGIFRSKLILGRKLNGLMDDVWLYRRALSSEEIQELYQTTIPNATLSISKCRLRMKPHLSFRAKKIYTDLYLSNPKPQGIVPVEVFLYKSGSNKSIQQKTIEDLSAVKSQEVMFSLAELPPGDYVVKALAKNSAGQTLAEKSEVVTLPEKPWWFDSKVGTEDYDKVFAPWTPLEVHRDERVEDMLPAAKTKVNCWGRTYSFGTGAFAEQISTAGRTILAEPIRLAGRIDGRNIRWEGETVQVQKETPTKVVLSNKLSDAALELTVDTLIEYDGMIRVDCQIRPLRSVKLEKLALEIPLRNEYATLQYQYRDRFFKAPGLLPKDGIVRNFNPAIWVGNEDLGLQWFTESDKDWYLADENRAIEIVREGSKVVLRINLVTSPIELKPGVARTTQSLPSLAYTFGLQATPVKPITKDAWDYRVVSATYDILNKQINSKPGLDYLAEKGVKTIFISSSWTKLGGYPGCIGYSDELHHLVQECHNRGMQIYVYYGSTFPDLAPEFPAFQDDFCTWRTSEPYSYSSYPNFIPPRPAQIAYSPCNRGEWQDFMLAGMARVMDEFDVDGVYLDGVVLGGKCFNTRHGCGGYLHPDGSNRPTYSFFAARNMARRLYHIVKSRKPDGQIDLHTAAFWASPTIAWATNVWDGETILGDTRRPSDREKLHLLDYLPPDLFKVHFMGKPWGVSADFLSYYVPLPYESVSAMTLLHDTLVRANNIGSDLELVSSLWQVSDEFGRKDAEWLPYWKNSEYVRVQSEGAYVSLYKHPKNGVLAVVSNLGKKKAQVTADFALDKLGLTEKSTAIDALTNESIPIKKGKVTVELNSIAWKLIWIKP